jgi:PIN domain nuclease of toxin-antitoxin system
MKVLLDTHSLIWAVLDPPSLSRLAQEFIQDTSTTVYVSAASAWEIATKVRIGKLPNAVELERRFIEIVVDIAQYTLLPILPETALRAGRLRGDHGDPFDRMIAAQALALDISVISNDKALDEFGVRRIW